MILDLLLIRTFGQALIIILLFFQEALPSMTNEGGLSKKINSGVLEDSNPELEGEDGFNVPVSYYVTTHPGRREVVVTC